MAGNNALARESISKSGIPVVFFFRLDINYWCFPPYKRLFSFYNAVKIMAIVCASKSIGVAQNKNLRKPRSTFSSSRVDSKSFLLSSSSFLTSAKTSADCVCMVLRNSFLLRRTCRKGCAWYD